MLIKSTKLNTALVTMVTAVFYATVVKFIASGDWITTLIVIATTHFLGVWLAMSFYEIIDKKKNISK